MISDFDKLPDPVKKMLTETPQGLRNQTIMFLVPFTRFKYTDYKTDYGCMGGALHS